MSQRPPTLTPVPVLRAVRKVTAALIAHAHADRPDRDNVRVYDRPASADEHTTYVPTLIALVVLAAVVSVLVYLFIL